MSKKRYSLRKSRYEIGEKLRLLPLEKARVLNSDINPMMEKHFGKEVTLSVPVKRGDYSVYFKECDGYNWYMCWFEDLPYMKLDDNLFVI